MLYITSITQSLKFFVVLVCACALALTPTASAQEEQGFYTSIELGQATIADWCKGVRVVFDNVTSCEDTELFYRTAAGYRLNSFLAAEFGLWRAEGYKYSISDNNSPATLKSEILSLSLGMQLKYPITEHVSALTRFGMHRWDYSVKVTGTSFSGDDDGTDPYFGLGGEIAIFDDFKISAVYTRFKFDGDDIDTIGASLNYGF